MKHFRWTLALMLALTLCLTSAAWAESPAAGHLGEVLPDFTVDTIDGGTFTLSEALAEKDMVLINLWASWCGPCAMEFPYMQAAYEACQDRVAVIALSVEPTDTMEVLSDYAAEKGLTFAVGNQGDLNLGSAFAQSGIPTSLVIDRFGVVCYIGVGAQTTADAFIRLFNYFTGEDYTESRLLDGPPPARPGVTPTDEALLSEAANAEGSALAFRNAANPYVWPMIVEETPQGHTALISSNWGEDSSACSVLTTVSAAAGDALAFEFFTSTESACDLLTVSVDGTTVKCFGGEHDWTQWAIPLSEGQHEIAFSYTKDVYAGAGDDLVRIDNVRLLTGEEAAATLAALPVFPTADEISLTVANEDAREIVFEVDEAGLLPGFFHTQSYWIVPSGTARAPAFITPAVDPEAAFFFSNYDSAQASLSEALTADGSGYVVSTPIDTIDATGYACTGVYFYTSATATDSLGVTLFADEANLTALLDQLKQQMPGLSWRYADDGAASDADARNASGVSEYTVRFVDQNGEPVPGCIVNFCTDEACMPVTADENGVAAFSGEPYAYHLQVIRVPAGYEFDTTQEVYAEEAGGELSFTVTKK